MPNYTSFLGLYKPNRNDNLAMDTTLADNFSNIDSKLGSGLTDEQGKTYTTMKERLGTIDTQISNLDSIQVNVIEFGAVPDGITDSTQAFKDAIGTGNKVVTVPAGNYRVDVIELPSNTTLIGNGKTTTYIKANDSAPIENCVVTNQDWVNGNTNIFIKGMTLDWNKNDARYSAPNVSRPNGCTVALVYVTDSFVRDVEALDAKVHCFDITSSVGAFDKRSQRIWLDNCNGSGGGDDIFTTHYCDHIYIENCHGKDPKPMGTGGSNNNIFEVDDGSTNVALTNCYSKGGVRGIEVKGHSSAPAPSAITLQGCTAKNCIVGIEIRHIGHHTSTDPKSDSAHSINISNCTVIDPIRIAGLYDNVSVQAFRVGAYTNVNISNLLLLGGNDDINGTEGDTVAYFGYNSDNVVVNNISIRGFVNATQDIYVGGGDISNGKVAFAGINIWKSALYALTTGSGIGNCSFIGGYLLGTNKIGSQGVRTFAEGNIYIGLYQYGYETPASINGHTYDVLPNMLGFSFVGGSDSGHAVHPVSAVLSSSNDSEASGSRSTVIGSSRSSATGIGCSVLNSYNVINPTNDSTAWGWASGSVASSANRKVDINASNGDIKATGSITGASTFTDYAEYFESIDGIAIPTGTLVTLEGEKVRKANKGEEILGIISETAGIILGESSFSWANRYLTNEFGGLIYEDYEVEEDGIKRIVRLPKENPAYKDIGEEYIPRSERDEWNCVGLLGQIYIRVDETIKMGDSFEAQNGIATKVDNDKYKVMKITSKYNPVNGYGVAKAFIK